MRRRHYLLVAVLVYVTTLIVTAPADLCYRWAATWWPEIVRDRPLDGLDGTVWHGQADRASMAQGFVVRDLTWRFRPLDLLDGRLGVAVDGRWQGLALSTVIQTPLTGVADDPPRLTLRDIRSEARLERPPLASRLPFHGRGRLRLAIDELVVDPARRPLPIDRVRGRITLSGLTIDEGTPLAIGDVELRLETAPDGRITGRLKDAGQGPLGIDGEIRIDGDGDRYRLKIVLTLRDPSRGTLLQGLRLLGTPGPDGRLRIDHQGHLAQDLPWLLGLLSG